MAAAQGWGEAPELMRRGCVNMTAASGAERFSASTLGARGGTRGLPRCLHLTNLLSLKNHRSRQQGSKCITHSNLLRSQSNFPCPHFNDEETKDCRPARSWVLSDL